nr:hypothetical protein [Tanacetum cinerariifolium]
MTSFGYRLNPRYAIKECLSCGALYTGDFCCSKGNVEDKILDPKPPKNCARCAKCGHPVNGPYCQGCALLREKLKEDLVTYFQNFQNTFESFDDSTNVVNAPREPVVVKQDHGVNLPHIHKCCCECGNALDGIHCQQCIFKSCGKGAHTRYNCPPKVPIISNLEPCNQTMNNELSQTLPSFDPTCYSDKENSVPCISKPNFVDEYSNIFNPPPQLPIYYCEFCGINAQYGHYCTPQAPFINPEPGYSQDFNFPQDIHDFQQQKFNRYSFFEKPKVLLLAWDRIFKIKDALGTKQYKPEDLQDLFRELSNDVQNIHEELAEYINTPGWNRSAFYDDDDDDDAEVEEYEDDNEKLEKNREFKSSSFKRLRKVGITQRVESSNDAIVDDQEDASKQGRKIAKLDADEDVTLVDVDADTHGRIEEDVTAVKDINAAESEPTVFDDEEVTMSIAQTLIKMKAEKPRILDEQMAKRLQDEEIEQDASRER